MIDRIVKNGRLRRKIVDLEGILTLENYKEFLGQQTVNFVNEEIDSILVKYKDEVIEKEKRINIISMWTHYEF